MSYFPVVVRPGVRPQTSDHQVPFYFGASQVPNDLGIMRGKGMKGSPSMTHPADKDYSTKRGDKVFHRDGRFVKLFGRR